VMSPLARGLAQTNAIIAIVLPLRRGAARRNGSVRTRGARSRNNGK
jgi:hypothetical protein